MSITDGTILRVVVSIIWTDGNINQNVFNAVVTGAGSPWDADDIVQDAVSWAQDMYYNITGAISNECDASQIQVYEYDPVDDDWDEVGSSVWVWNPTGANEQLPRGVAALINLKTTDPDVSGKKYIGQLTEVSLADGLWDAAMITLLTSFAVDWYAGFTGTDSGATWTPGIWSVANTVFKAAISTAIIPTVPAYQRRRKRTVGI